MDESKPSNAPDIQQHAKNASDMWQTIINLYTKQKKARISTLKKMT